MGIDSEFENNLREYYQTLAGKYGGKLVQIPVRDGAIFQMAASFW
jgi:hypothetical protein